MLFDGLKGKICGIGKYEKNWKESANIENGQSIC